MNISAGFLKGDSPYAMMAVKLLVAAVIFFSVIGFYFFYISPELESQEGQIDEMENAKVEIHQLEGEIGALEDEVILLRTQEAGEKDRVFKGTELKLVFSPSYKIVDSRSFDPSRYVLLLHSPVTIYPSFSSALEKFIGIEAFCKVAPPCKKITKKLLGISSNSLSASSDSELTLSNSLDLCDTSNADNPESLKFSISFETFCLTSSGINEGPAPKCIKSFNIFFLSINTVYDS